MDAYWRAANYLSVGQIYLYDNPLLKRPLALADVKRMLLGHWGTTPGQNFIYVHLNRVIKKYDLDMIYVSGPVTAARPSSPTRTSKAPTARSIQTSARTKPACEALSAVFISRRHSQPRLARVPGLDPRGRRAGLLAQPFVRRGVRQSRSHRRLRRRRRRGGDRPARHGLAFQQVSRIRPPTAPCCRSCISTATRSPTRRSSPASSPRNWNSCCAATAGRPFRRGSRAGADARGDGRGARYAPWSRSRASSSDARVHGDLTRPRWPMIVLNHPRAGPDRRSSMASRSKARFARTRCRCPTLPTHPEHLKLLEDWLRSYRPEELFDEQGRLKPELAALAPKGERRMGANPHANGGILLRDLRMPDFRDYAVDVPTPGVPGIGDTHVLGRFLRDVAKLNQRPAQLPHLRPGRDALQRPGGRLRSDQPPVGRRDTCRTTNFSRPPDA